MGRRGYVEIRPPKYGSCVSDWAQRSFYGFLSGKTRLEVSTKNEWCPEDADEWEISIPMKSVGRGKKQKFIIEYDYVMKVAKRLRDKPGLVKDDDGEGEFGDLCAQLLEEGAAAAERQRRATITIRWW